MKLNKSLVALFLLSQSMYVFASEQSACTAADGALLTGTITSAPKFASGSSLKGIMLSHTHVSLRADQDSKVYDVAMDNVFALDYVKNANSMPKSLASMKVNDRIEVCGAKYTSGVGIHWVHNNCNAAPSTSAPNGWVKKLAGSTVGPNLESNQAYCYLWN
jgi:hypothetical protein